jgi:RNA polymerase sigma-70 factor (ECF subfamily)
MAGDGSGPSQEPSGRGRVASSLARSRERRMAEEVVITGALRELIRAWMERGEIERLQCMELLFVSGKPNKEVAQRLGISEQAVANHKHFVVMKLKEAATRAMIKDFNPADLGLE